MDYADQGLGVYNGSADDVLQRTAVNPDIAPGCRWDGGRILNPSVSLRLPSVFKIRGTAKLVKFCIYSQFIYWRLAFTQFNGHFLALKSIPLFRVHTKYLTHDNDP